MIRPTRGPVSSSESRRICTTTSGCTARTPDFTAASNSVDRLMRLRAGSTAEEPDVAIRQLTRDGLCGAGWRRSIARRGCASASGSHARGLGAGYSAGRSACPWPRRSPRLRTIRPHSSATRSEVGLAAGRRGPRAFSGSQPYRRLSGDCLRVLMRIRWVKLGLPQRTQLTHPRKRKFSKTSLRHHRTTSDKQGPDDPKEADWNAAELLAAERKTVSFGQCRFRVERRSTTKRGWRID